MTTIDLVPIRTLLVKAFIFLAEKANIVENLSDFLNFPTAFTFEEKTCVKKQALEEYITSEYQIPEEKMESALQDLQDKGMVELHQVDLHNERANYLQLTNRALYPTDLELENLFSKNIG